MGKTEPERNAECGTAEPGRMESECGNVDEGPSGRMKKFGTIGEHVMCRAEPTKIGQAEQGRMETECGNVDGRRVE